MVSFGRGTIDCGVSDRIDGQVMDHTVGTVDEDRFKVGRRQFDVVGGFDNDIVAASGFQSKASEGT
jgi:hypothetical protein